MAVVLDDMVFMLFYVGFMASMGMAIAFGAILALFLITTPAKMFFKAKRKKLPIIAAWRRDKKVDLHVADDYEQGLVTSKKYGAFIVDPNGVYTEMKTGVPILLANAEVGITLDPHIVSIIDGVKRMGLDNIEDAEALNNIWGVCTGCGFEGPMNVAVKKDNEGKDVQVLVCPYEEKEVENVRTEEKREKPGTTGDSPEPTKPPLYVSDKDRAKEQDNTPDNKEELPDSGPGENV